MSVVENLGEIMASGTVPAVSGDASDAVTVLTTLNWHARSQSLLKDAIAAMLASEEDYWVGMGIDEVVVRVESAAMVTVGIESRGTAGRAVVVEFVRSKPSIRCGCPLTVRDAANPSPVSVADRSDNWSLSAYAAGISLRLLLRDTGSCTNWVLGPLCGTSTV